MTKNFEVQGEFWLPDFEDRKVAGILTFDRKDGGRLALIGSLETAEDIFRNQSRDYSRILGNDGRNLYTLDGCFRTQSSMSFPGHAGRQGFYVGRIVKGTYAYSKDETVSVDGLAVRITNMLDWVRINGLQAIEHFAETKPPSREWEILGERQPSITCAIDNGTLKLGHQLWRTESDIHGVTIKQDNYAKFEFISELALDDAIDRASDLQDLISIATTRVSTYKAIHLYHPVFAHERQDGTRIPQPAELYVEWIAQAQHADKKPTKHDMLFTFDQFDGITGVARWMATAQKYRSTLGRVMNTIYSPFMFVQDKILHRVAALEAFHKQWSGNPNAHLVDRLKELATYAGKPFETLVGKKPENENIATWCEKAKDERHDTAHHLGRQLHQDGGELFYVGQGAYWLFVICLLREAQAPPAAFDQMTKCPTFVFESREIRNIL